MDAEGRRQLLGSLFPDFEPVVFQLAEVAKGSDCSAG
jgi:hypothetical protein